MKTAVGRKLRIAVLMRDFIPVRGAEKYCVELTRRLAREHEVHVFAQAFSGEQILGVHYHRIRRWLEKPRWINHWLFARQTRDAVGRVGRGFDIVHSHDVLGYADVYTVHVPCFRSRYSEAAGLDRLTLWLRTLISPRLLSYYLTEARQFSTRRRPKRFIAVSDYMRRNIERNYPAARDCIRTAYPGLESGDIAPAPQQRERYRRELGLAAESFVCLFAASNFKKKGLGPLLRALERIKGDCTLLVAGEGRQEEYRARIAQLGLGRRVRFLGVRSDMEALFGVADALVHPTREDTFGMTVLEAMAHGLPVIVSSAQYCGIAEQLSGETALLLDDPGDPVQIARCISALMGDAALRDKLRENGRRFASGASWERTAEATLRVYQELLDMRELLDTRDPVR